MAMIVKSADAPEGDLKVSTGQVEFKLTDGEGYETTDPAAIDAAVTHPFLDVEYPELGGAKEAARAQTKAIREHAKAVEKADKMTAEKDPYDDPVTAEDVLAEKAEKAAADNKESK